MTVLDRLIPPLRVLLVLVFAGLVVGEVMSLPGQFLTDAAEAPEGFRPVYWVLLAASILGAVALQIVIVCVWRLLTLVRSDRIFSEQSFRWVDVIAWTIGLAWVVLGVVSVFLVSVLYLTPQLRDPGLPILLVGATLIGAVVALVVLVLRALLRQAAAQRAELEQVI
jgi:hypothetical protein